MKKVPVTYVDLYDVLVWLKDGDQEPIKLAFQSKELVFSPMNGVMAWLAITGELYTVNVDNLLYARQTPCKTHVEEVEVP